MSNRSAGLQSAAESKRSSPMPNRMPAPAFVRTSTATSPLVSADDFEALVADSIRQMRRSVQVDRVQARVLDDLSRRRGLSMVRQALEIARSHCGNPTDATALPEAMRGFVLSGHRTECSVVDSFLVEQDSNRDFDKAQLRYMREPTRVNRSLAIEAGNRQLMETRRALDALHRDGR